MSPLSPSLTSRLSSLVLAASLLAAGCGSPAAPAPAGEPTPAAPATPQPAEQPEAGPTEPPAAEQPPAAASEDLESRVSEAYNRTLGTAGELPLGSLHLEIRASEPSWDPSSGQVIHKDWSLSADLQGDDVYFVYVEADQRTEAWLLDQQGEEGGRGYELVEGQVQESFMAPLAWLAALGPAFPLAVAATGPALVGQETVDGRPAEKYEVDSARAPPGVMEALGMVLTIRSSKGTVWVDQATGALLKAVLDYEQDFLDPDDPERKKVLARGSGRLEIEVTRVGQVTVQLP